MSALRFGWIFRYVVLIAVVIGSALVMPNVAKGQQSATNKQPDQSDPWKPLRPFVGKWEGDSQGQPGVGKMEREYVFVLRDRFVRVSNMAVYPPQKKNPKGETHEDLGFFSYDRGLKETHLSPVSHRGFRDPVLFGKHFGRSPQLRLHEHGH
ncbi:hypothetical protein BH18ACI4_BH18ACI4_10260 [soil metagenome]